MSMYPTGDLAARPPRRLRSQQQRQHQSQLSTIARRAAKEAAVCAAQIVGARRGLTTETVGADIVDHIDDLDPRSLHILSVVFTALRRVKG